MKRDSEELARRVDVEVAYQNGAEMQYRNTGMKTWIDLSRDGGLSFNWERCDFRVKPAPREGFVFAEQMHQHPSDHKWKRGKGTCFPVREVMEDE